MIYKNDVNKKKSYVTRLIAYYLIFIAIFIAVMFIMSKFVSVKISHIFIIAGVLAVIFALFTIRGIILYPTYEVELTDTVLYSRVKGKTWQVNIDEIKKIVHSPTSVDREALVVYGNKNKGILIHSYIENFEEFKEELLKAKPLEIKKAVALTVFKIVLYVFIIAPIFSLMSKNIPLIFITNILGILACSFIIFSILVSYSIKKQKIMICLIYGVLSMVYIFNSFTYGILMRNNSYRINSEGKKVLMKKEAEYKYDKNGNLIYFNGGYSKYKYKYDENNNEIYFEDMSDHSKTWYEYEDGLCIKSIDSDGVIREYEYDSRRNKIRVTSNSTFENVREYDENNNLVSSVSSDGISYYAEYDQNGNVIYKKNVYKNGEPMEVFYKYDDEGRVIYQKYNKTETFTTYMAVGDMTETSETIVVDDVMVSVTTTLYDSNENPLKIIAVSYGDKTENNPEDLITTYEYKYDEHNNVIYFNYEDSITEYSYDYDSNGNILRKYSYLHKNP